MNRSELEEVFKNVRSSYRLLYDYQKRVLDLVKYIGNKLDYGAAEGVPAFSGAAPRERKKGIFDLWSWDWLNMYHYKFSFLPKTVDSGKVYLDIHIISDTGYYIMNSASKHNTQKTDLDNFAGVEESQTRLILYASKNEFLWKDILESKNGEFKPHHPEVNVLIEKKDNQRIIGKNYSLPDFFNSTEVDKRLDEFRTFCSSNGISM